jgi:hypothetical protein
MRRVATFIRYALVAIALAIGGAGAAGLHSRRSVALAGYVQAPGCLASGPLAGLCTSKVTGTILSSSSSFTGGDETRRA